MLNVKFRGEMYEQKCTLSYYSDVLFDGYVDDLITSSEGYLQIRLNYSESNTFVVRVKRYSEWIVWLPDKNPLSNVSSFYKPIVLHVSEMEKLWTACGYDLVDDLQFIADMEWRDFKYFWLIGNPAYIHYSGVVEEQTIRNSIVAYAEVEKYLVEHLTDYLNSHGKI